MFFTQAVLATDAIAAKGAEGAQTIATKIAEFFEYIFSRVPSWIAGAIIFVLAIFIAKMAKAAVEARISDQIDEEHQEILVLVGRVTYFGTLTVGITVALKIAGIDLTTILAAVAFGIGFALRDMIMNFLAGVMILVSRQFTIGDCIKVGDTIGKIEEIQTRATILKAFDGTKVIVPNAEIFSKQVVSLTSNPLRRVTIPVYIAYGTDIGFATKVVLKTMQAHPKVLKKPAPAVLLTEYGSSSIDLTARFWVGSRSGWVKIKSEMMKNICEALEENGIVVPYDILHLETSQDTAKEWDDAAELLKKRKAELKAAARAAAAAPKAPTTTTAMPIAAPKIFADTAAVQTAQAAIPKASTNATIVQAAPDVSPTSATIAPAAVPAATTISDTAPVSTAAFVSAAPANGNGKTQVTAAQLEPVVATPAVSATSSASPQNPQTN